MGKSRSVSDWAQNRCLLRTFTDSRFSSVIAITEEANVLQKRYWRGSDSMVRD